MLKVIYGEIAEADTDVIVNAANGCGWMGGKRCRNELRRGVAEHLNFYTKGALEEEAVRAARRSPRIPALFRGQEPGGFFTTPPCGLHCKEVIHAVTMRYPGHRSRLENIRSVLSKIFLHCKSNTSWNTSGCVSLTEENMVWLLKKLKNGGSTKGECL